MGNCLYGLVLITAEDAERLQPGWRKPLPVKVKVNNKPDTAWRINAMPVGDGSFYLYLHEDVRKASKTRVGDRVNVDLAFDNEYRSGPAHPMPDWFGKELDQCAEALQKWQI
ncbi:DUF1905 domain-containing protein [Neptunicella sp. SCSIO 80796]|uniref:DUF1905 domain-containing protein n=1 Tax=Neptunicella plasticusilytica TaxID=3117012 RepID=UPI003A4DF5AF